MWRRADANTYSNADSDSNTYADTDPYSNSNPERRVAEQYPCPAGYSDYR